MVKPPRSLSLSQLLNFRREKFNGDRSISYANVALSDRISQFPERFYLSGGRQSWEDLTILFEEIKTGHHTLFGEGAQIDIFSYSIGTFLSQVALMANDKDLFFPTPAYLCFVAEASSVPCLAYQEALWINLHLRSCNTIILMFSVTKKHQYGNKTMVLMHLCE